MPAEDFFYFSGKSFLSDPIAGTGLQYACLSMAVFPMSRITDSSLGIAPRILVTRRKSFCRRSIQLVVYIIDCIAG